MDKLPDYLIENYIIPYLTSYDLFYKFRTLGSYYYYCARNKILTHFPGEMMIKLKKIIDINAKEDLTKNFDEITKRTFNEKKTLMLLMLQVNLSLIVKKILETTRDERVIELISFLYVITKNEEKHNLMEQRNYDEIIRLSGEEEGIIEMRTKITDVLEEDDLDYDLNEYITVYESLDREYLLSDNYTTAVYTFIRMLIQFCETKIRFNDIKLKLESFFKQISEASDIWPKKRIFYEKSIDLIADSQILSNGAKQMIKLMKKYDIENELTDFAYERDVIDNFSDPEAFNVVKNNRKKLNLAIVRIHQMYYFFSKCIEYDKNKEDIEDKEETIYNINSNKIRFNVGGMIFNPEEFLYILSMIKKQFPINEQTFFISRHYLYNNIIYNIYNIVEEKEEDENNENKDEKNISLCCTCCGRCHSNKKDNNKKVISCITQIDDEHLREGIEDLQTVLENTKMAGKEINESFQKFAENLSDLNMSLANNNNDE
jgi:cytochrome c553